MAHYTFLFSQFILFYLVDCQLFRDVTTKQGIVRGYTVNADDVFTFYGIPYATAPSGENRFKAPLPPPTWDGVFEATEYFVCPQSTQFHFNITMKLDCLVANVFVPNTQETNLPVLFYIHGGGYQMNDPAEFLPIKLTRRGMVVVNFNYRVGVYGLLCLNNEFAPGNAGLKDQVEALRWVKRNIANFGGDPDNISIGGNSAGSFSVELQIFSPMSNGLFNKAISEGGSGLAPEVVTPNPLALAERLAQSFGITTNQDVDSLTNFFRNLSDDQLYVIPHSLSFWPCVETHNIADVEKFLVEYPMDTIVNGNYEKIPYLSGFTPMEGMEFLGFYETRKPAMETNLRQFIPITAEFESEEKAVELVQMLKDLYFPTAEVTLQGYVDFYTETVFSYPQYVSARIHSMNSMPVYLYVFDFNGTINLPSVHDAPIWGPGHVAQTLYLQQRRESFVYDRMTAEEYVIQDRLIDIYYNFVKYGVPRSNVVDVDDWIPTTAEGVEYLHMQSDFFMDEKPLRERFDAWDKLHRHHPYLTDSAATMSLSVSVFTFCVFIKIFVF